MRKITCSSIFLLGLLALITSCKKDSFNERQSATTINQTVSAKIAANQSYQMDLTDAGNVSISRQASHYSVSQTAMDNAKGGTAYTYIPAKDFIGTDEVVLLASKTVVNTSYNNGGGCHSGSNASTSSISNKYITVKITVGD
jgi:hypothetical protein